MNSTGGNVEVTNNEMYVSQVLDAPVDSVWNAWTLPEQIAKWWGPHGFSNTIHALDVSNEGEWRMTMQGPDGKTFPNKSIFIEIIKYEKIQFRHFNPNYIATIHFTPGEDKTLLEWSVRFETPQLFETVVKVFKADDGLKQNVEKLVDYLEKQLK
jgi:uncharacterized protein YndB with AHSA1/START domain